MEMTEINDMIAEARAEAEAEHGKLTGDLVRAAGILTEEVGEVMAEALTATRASMTDSGKVNARRRMVGELAQVAATAMLMMENLVRGMGTGANAKGHTR